MAKKLTMFERFKDGKVVSRTPVLSRKRQEDKEKFLDRMRTSGYESLDKTEYHFADDEMSIHSYPKDKCKVCRKFAKSTEKTDLKAPVIPK